MPVHFRVIRYEFEREEDLDRQLRKSLADGKHLFPNNDNILVKDIPQDSHIQLMVASAIQPLLENTRPFHACITKEQAAFLPPPP